MRVEQTIAESGDELGIRESNILHTDHRVAEDGVPQLHIWHVVRDTEKVADGLPDAEDSGVKSQ